MLEYFIFAFYFLVLQFLIIIGMFIQYKSARLSIYPFAHSIISGDLNSNGHVFIIQSNQSLTNLRSQHALHYFLCLGKYSLHIKRGSSWFLFPFLLKIPTKKQATYLVTSSKRGEEWYFHNSVNCSYGMSLLVNKCLVEQKTEGYGRVYHGLGMRMTSIMGTDGLNVLDLLPNFMQPSV